MFSKVARKGRKSGQPAFAPLVQQVKIFLIFKMFEASFASAPSIPQRRCFLCNAPIRVSKMPFAADLLRLRQVFFGICLAAGSSVVCSAQTGSPAPEPLPARVGQLLSWLPEDTETILVANQSFAMPGFKHQDADEPSSDTSPAQLTERFETLPLSLFELKDSLLQNFLMGQKVEVAIEGSRHFRRPSSLFGAMPYEGCQIAILA